MAGHSDTKRKATVTSKARKTRTKPSASAERDESPITEDEAAPRVIDESDLDEDELELLAEEYGEDDDSDGEEGDGYASQSLREGQKGKSGMPPVSKRRRDRDAVDRERYDDPWKVEEFKDIHLGDPVAKSRVDPEKLKAGDDLLKGVILKRLEQARREDWRDCMSPAAQDFFVGKGSSLELLWPVVETCVSEHRRAALADGDLDFAAFDASPGFSDAELNVPGVYEAVIVEKDGSGLGKYYGKGEAKCGQPGVGQRLMYYNDRKRVSKSDPEKKRRKKATRFEKAFCVQGVEVHYRKWATFVDGVAEWSMAFLEGLAVDAGSSLGDAKSTPHSKSWRYARDSFLRASLETMPEARHQVNFTKLNFASPFAQVSYSDTSDPKAARQKWIDKCQAQGGLCAFCDQKLPVITFEMETLKVNNSISTWTGPGPTGSIVHANCHFVVSSRAKNLGRILDEEIVRDAAEELRTTYAKAEALGTDLSLKRIRAAERKIAEEEVNAVARCLVCDRSKDDLEAVATSVPWAYFHDSCLKQDDSGKMCYKCHAKIRTLQKKYKKQGTKGKYNDQFFIDAAKEAVQYEGTRGNYRSKRS